jgi:hypothetical protein
MSTRTDLIGTDGVLVSVDMIRDMIRDMILGAKSLILLE